MQVPQTSASELESARAAKQSAVLANAGAVPTTTSGSVVKQASSGTQQQVCLEENLTLICSDFCAIISCDH